MRHVLITGFEPFGGDSRNPSQEIASKLDGCVVGGRRVAGVLLPCVFGDSIAILKREIKRHRPGLVICLGLAGGRADITPERVAINVDDARIPDNHGKQPVDRPIVRGGPAAYFATLPIKAVVAAMREKNIRASVSQSAGTFVCNHVFYGLMHHLGQRPGIRGGFIHLPFLPEQVPPGGQPSLPLPVMIDAITCAIEVSLQTKRDPRLPGGRVH